MTQKIRKALYTTTILAGIAIAGIGGAQAGPNSFGGGGGGFSSMRMDFGRFGNTSSADRMIAPEQRRVVPLDVTTKSAKKDEKKNAKKKGTDIASVGRITRTVSGIAPVSNPAPSQGGSDKAIAQNGPNLQLAPAIAEMFGLFGGNLAAIDELKSLLASGLLVLSDPINPAPGDWTPPTPPPGAGWAFGQGNQRDHEAEAASMFDNGSAPGLPNTSATGQASQDGNRRGYRREVRPHNDGNFLRDAGFTTIETFTRGGVVVRTVNTWNGYADTAEDDDGNPVVVRERQVSVTENGVATTGETRTVESRIIITPGDGRVSYQAPAASPKIRPASHRATEPRAIPTNASTASWANAGAKP